MTPGIPGIDHAQTPDRDLPLFRKLRLPAFSIPADKQRRFVGTVILDGGATVMVWVEAYPALFWSFDIRSLEGHFTKLQTGSGALVDYWLSVELIATGMVVITEFRECGSVEAQS